MSAFFLAAASLSHQQTPTLVFSISNIPPANAFKPVFPGAPAAYYQCIALRAFVPIFFFLKKKLLLNHSIFSLLFNSRVMAMLHKIG